MFVFSLLLSACGINLTDESAADRLITEQPTSIPTETIAPTPTATEVVPEYAYIVTPEIRNYENCQVTEEQLLSGDYWNWLNEVVAPTLLWDFKAREDQIRDDIPLTVLGLGGSDGSAFFYDDEGVYKNEEVSPWDRRVTFATTSILDPIENKTLNYVIMPVFYYDKDHQQIYPVVTVAPIFHGEKLSEETIDDYLNFMNMPVIIYSSHTGAFEKDNIEINEWTDPLVSKAYEKLDQDEIWDRTQRFSQGDFSAFSSPKIIVRAEIRAQGFYQ